MKKDLPNLYGNKGLKDADDRPTSWFSGHDDLT